MHFNRKLWKASLSLPRCWKQELELGTNKEWHGWNTVKVEKYEERRREIYIEWWWEGKRDRFSVINDLWKNTLSIFRYTVNGCLLPLKSLPSWTQLFKYWLLLHLIFIYWRSMAAVACLICIHKLRVDTKSLDWSKTEFIRDYTFKFSALQVTSIVFTFRHYLQTELCNLL